MNSIDILKIKGQALAKSGSFDKGLLVGDAIQYIQEIFKEGGDVTGLEIWRETGGGHRADALMTWYPIFSKEKNSCVEAIEYLTGVNVGPQDLVAIQLRKS